MLSYYHRDLQSIMTHRLTLTRRPNDELQRLEKFARISVPYIGQSLSGLKPLILILQIKALEVKASLLLTHANLNGISTGRYRELHL